MTGLPRPMILEYIMTGIKEREQEKKKSGFRKYVKTIVSLILCVFFVACGDKSSSSSGDCSHKVPISVGPGTAGNKGITVVRKGAATQMEADRIKEQITTRISKAACNIKGLYAKKKIIMGLIDNDAHADMAFFQNRKINGYDGVELIYTDKSSDGNALGNRADNEAEPGSAKRITCEKMMQLFDYYIADSALRKEINDAYLDIKGHAGLNYDNCAAYGNAAQIPVCAPGSDGALADPAHPAGMDLNPGAVLGTICAYQLDSAGWVEPGEFLGTLGTDYTLQIAEFDKMKAFLSTYFGI